MRLVFLAAFLVGCVSMQSMMDKWVGAKDTDLVSEWGAPARETTLSDGSRVMTWRKPWTDSGGERLICEQSFTITHAGTVARWSVQNCPKRFIAR